MICSQHNTRVSFSLVMEKSHCLPLSVLFLLQHFVCAKCEKPFLGHRHYEKKGLAYCETHYNQVNSAICAVGACSDCEMLS